MTDNPNTDKLPWFPLWAADFANSRKVRTMTPAQVGIFVLLLCSEWSDGPIPDDPEVWRGLTNGADDNDVIKTLQRCFSKSEKGWVNERLERVRKDQLERRNRYVEAGRASAKSRWGNGVEHRSGDVIKTLQHPITNQSQSHKQNTNRRTRLSDSWEPTELHRERASRAGLDLGREVEKFRSHADANGRLVVNWNSAFTTWLMNAEEFARPNGRPTGPPAQKLHRLRPDPQP